jgi:F420-0:gamma-glutamyl ligase
MIIAPIKTRVFNESEALLPFIARYIKKIPERSVLVVTSKIVALSEKRTAVITSARTKPTLIRKESEVALRTKYVWLTVKDGMMMASAGIDESNANGKLILLPRDSFKAAHLLRKELRRRYRVKHLGILITDSRTVPLRLGVTGVALGYAGFRGIRDYRGMPDIFGRRFRFAQTNVADGLAAAAVLAMGEGNERQPLALIQDAPVKFCKRVNPEELRIDIRDDMYKPLFARLSKRRRLTK